MQLRLKQLFIFLFCSFFSINIFADQDLISLFPLDHYDQQVATWINPDKYQYDSPLLTPEMQKKRFEIFYDHYFGEASPWNAAYIKLILSAKAPDDLKTIEQSIINNLNNDNKPADKIGYGENFRSHAAEWMNAIVSNMNIAQFDQLSYLPAQRAIAVDNLHVRALPTEDVHFYSHKIAGEGYPFDNLQESAIFAGTPIYILAETHDHAWSFIATPDVIGWVKSNGLGRVNDTFIVLWQSAAKKQLAAITRTEVSILDEQKQFLFKAFVGAVFPAEKKSYGMKLMVPVTDEGHHAGIKFAVVSAQDAQVMPLSITPHHFADLIATLIGRPYGWGGMYLYNDCSAELKSLFTPFGVWLPRHSSEQVKVGGMVDMTHESPERRLGYLIQNGRPFLTLVYIGGHIFMLIGAYQNPNSSQHEWMALSYQNMWGLSPNPPIRRAVIGQAVFLPILLQYPEDPSLNSQANKKYFQVSFLDHLPENNLLRATKINLRSMMMTEEEN